MNQHCVTYVPATKQKVLYEKNKATLSVKVMASSNPCGGL